MQMDVENSKGKWENGNVGSNLWRWSHYQDFGAITHSKNEALVDKFIHIERGGCKQTLGILV